jgi:hypothetical protein
MLTIYNHFKIITGEAVRVARLTIQLIPKLYLSFILLTRSRSDVPARAMAVLSLTGETFLAFERAVKTAIVVAKAQPRFLATRHGVFSLARCSWLLCGLRR